LKECLKQPRVLQVRASGTCARTQHCNTDNRLLVFSMEMVSG
jgi:hypothetical protein